MPVLLRAFAEVASQKQTVQLGDTSYLVTFNWRELTFAWYMTITTLDEVAILTGVRLEPNQAPMRFADSELFPDGVTIAQIMIVLYQAVEHFFIWRTANLTKS